MAEETASVRRYDKLDKSYRVIYDDRKKDNLR